MKSLFALLVVVVVGVGVYLVWPQLADAPHIQDVLPAGQNTEVEGPVVDNEFEVLIVYTENGYEPKTVTIQKGDTVRFVNNAAEQESWPASAVHPTHSIYPGKSDDDCLGSSFDSCRGLLPGEFWEFTFDEVGEWRFHDHLHPSKTGSVIVTE